MKALRTAPADAGMVSFIRGITRAALHEQDLQVRCDRISAAYRRYLRDNALRYGVLSAAARVRD